MTQQGVHVSGSDAVDSPVLDALREEGITCFVGHAAEQLDGVDTVVASTAVREDNPEIVEAAAARAAAVAALCRPAFGHGGAPHGGGRRHARQDHHHGDAHLRARRRRRGPVVRDRRRGRRAGHQRAHRGRRPVGRRGRRERRRVPRLRARGRRRHERRRRPPRHLGHRGGLRRRPSTTSSARSAEFVVARRRRRRGPRAGPASLASAWPRGRHHGCGRGRRRPGHRSRGRGGPHHVLASCATTRIWSTSRSPSRAPTTRRTPSLALAAGLVLGQDAEALAAGLSTYAGAQPPHGASRRRRRRPGLRLLRPPPHRDPGRPRGRPRPRRRRTPRRGVPAPPRQPHPRVRRRDGSRAARAADRVVVADLYLAREDPDPAVTAQLVVDAVDGPAATPGGPVDDAGRRCSCPSCDPATCCSPSAPATSPPSGRRCSPCWRRRRDVRSGSPSAAGPSAGAGSSRAAGPARASVPSAALVWVIWFSSALAVNRIEVEGTTTLKPMDIRSQAAVRLGEPLARVDTVAIESRVARDGAHRPGRGLASAGRARSGSRSSSASRSAGCCPAARSARSIATASTSARCAPSRRTSSRSGSRPWTRASVSRRSRQRRGRPRAAAHGRPAVC